MSAYTIVTVEFFKGKASDEPENLKDFWFQMLCLAEKAGGHCAAHFEGKKLVLGIKGVSAHLIDQEVAVLANRPSAQASVFKVTQTDGIKMPTPGNG